MSVFKLDFFLIDATMFCVEVFNYDNKAHSCGTESVISQFKIKTSSSLDVVIMEL